MLDGVVLGTAGGIVGDGDFEAVGIAEGMLQGVLPGAGVAAVAAAAVGKDGELGGVGIAALTGGSPPVVETVDREERRVVGVADDDSAVVGEQVVDAVGNGEAVGEGTEVVVEDLDGLLFPGGAGVLEVADEFLLLGVDADQGAVLGGATTLEGGDEFKLGVAVGRGDGGELLAVDAQGEAGGGEQAGDGAGGEGEAEGGEGAGELGGGAVSPVQVGARVSGGVVFEQSGEGSAQCRVFFSRAWRPPPGRRTCPRGSRTAWSSSSRRPRATVEGCRPVRTAARRSPPCPLSSEASPP